MGGRSTSHICYIGIIPIGCSLPAYLCDGISLKNRTNLTLETHMLLPIPWFTFHASKLHLSNLLVYLLLSKPTIMTINHHKSANGCSPCRVSAIFCIGITHALATLGFPTRPHWGDSNTCLALLGLSDLTICRTVSRFHAEEKSLGQVPQPLTTCLSRCRIQKVNLDLILFFLGNSWHPKAFCCLRVAFFSSPPSSKRRSLKHSPLRLRGFRVSVSRILWMSPTQQPPFLNTTFNLFRMFAHHPEIKWHFKVSRTSKWKKTQPF